MGNYDSESQARAQLASVEEMVQAVRTAGEGDDYDAQEEAQRAIHEDALSLEVRSGWHCPSVHGADAAAEEYRICLCTGGPAVQIVGTLGQYGEPDTARIEHQDWGTPWTDLPTTQDEESALVEYAGQFFFGE
jgi:hypothetical protein